MEWNNYKPYSLRTVSREKRREKSATLCYLLLFVGSPWGGTTWVASSPANKNLGTHQSTEHHNLRLPQSSSQRFPLPSMRQREDPALNCPSDEHGCRVLTESFLFSEKELTELHEDMKTTQSSHWWPGTRPLTELSLLQTPPLTIPFQECCPMVPEGLRIKTPMLGWDGCHLLCHPVWWLTVWSEGQSDKLS